MMTRRSMVATVVVALGLLASACGGGGDDPASQPSSTAPSGQETLSVVPAGYDLAVGDDQRFLAGLFTSDRSLILGGQVDMQFFYLGTAQGSESPEPTETTTGTFLPVPGKEPEQELSAPTKVGSGLAAGVYETQVSFDRAGFWGVSVNATLADGQVLQGTGSFSVTEEHQVPEVGDPAPTVDNLTVDSDAPPVAIDSRAQGDDPVIPDPQLHDTTIAAAIAAHRPVVVVISTPTYCVSQFCGPTTETIEQLADQYADRAAFVHLEVWKDFNANELNDAAAAWIQTEQGGNEPWVFFVDADGIIRARWDNVLDKGALVDLLEGLPGT